MGNNVSTEFSTEQSRPNQPVYDQYDNEPLNDENAVVVTSPSGARRSRIEARKHLREELFGSDGKGAWPEKAVLSECVDTPQSSLQIDLSSKDTNRPVTVDTALLILKELKKTASPDEILALQMALLPTNQKSDPGVKFKPETVGPAAAALIRRRSLFTPGVATRNNSKGNVLRKVPSTKPNLTDKAWNSEMFGAASPLEKLASIDQERANAYSSLTRAETPSVLGTSYLGVHNIGSLRVTNGTASPEPSLYSALSHEEYPTSFSIKDDDYYTASEGSAGRCSPESLLSVKSRVFFSSSFSTGHSISGQSLVKEQNEHSKISTETLRASTPGQIYLPESTSNPFSSTASDTEACSVSSIDDREDIYEPSLYTERSKSVYSSNAQTCYSSSQSETKSNYNGSTSRNISLLDQSQAKQLSKSDSGYVSDSSILTLRPLNTSYTIEEATPYSEYDLTKQDLKPESKASNDHNLYYITPKKSHFSFKSSKKHTSPIDGKVIYSRRSSLQLTPEKLSSGVKSSNEEAGTSALKQRKETPKKLQKARPISERTKSEPLIVQGQSPIFTTPIVPDEVISKHTGRMDKSPGMDHLEHTYKSVAHSKDEEEEEVSIYNISFRFPSPAPTLEQNPKRAKKKKKSGLAPETPPHRLFRKRPPLNASNKYIHDFGTVVSSLGASPYEISNAYVDDRSSIQNVIHPHQMTAPIFRSRSVGMSEKDAAEFAMLRSRDRLAKLHQDYQTSTVQDKSTPEVDSDSYPTLKAHATQNSNDDNFGNQKSFVSLGENNDTLINPNDEWEIHAQAWRLRRKSIGENLLQQAYNENDAYKSLVNRSPSTYKPRFYAKTFDNHLPDEKNNEPLSFRRESQPLEAYVSNQEPTLPSVTLDEISPKIKGSLTIRERAALFERPVYHSYKHSLI